MKINKKTWILLTCTSRLFAFPFRLPRGLFALPRASDKPSHLFSGVWASRYSRLYDFLHRLYRIELAASAQPCLFPCCCTANPYGRRRSPVNPPSPLAYSPLDGSIPRPSQENDPAPPPALLATAFAQNISFRTCVVRFLCFFSPDCYHVCRCLSFASKSMAKRWCAADFLKIAFSLD